MRMGPEKGHFPWWGVSLITALADDLRSCFRKINGQVLFLAFGVN
jgi:molybdopterin-guanine dinucleotide biosynthesis protein A